tara:strand:+ start:6801 stop:7565 length:765 start_codon:yes stop_codon:yes gene_type:complete
MKNKLNKIKFDNNLEIEYYNYANINILDFINSELVKNQDNIWNYRENIILIERDNKLYHWYRNENKLSIVNEKYFITPILGYGIYKDINIFSQNNNNIANIIYSLVFDLFEILIDKLLKIYKNINLYGIGSEFYVYFKILKMKYLNIENNNNFSNITYKGYANSVNILETAEKNNSCDTYELINYNTYDFNMKNNGITIINLNKINKNIIKNLKTEYVISISHTDKTIYSNYKALSIKQIFNLNNVKITLFKII